jgi:hypothetical protein
VIRRPGVIALARAVHALFFLVLSAYCFLAYTPFAYDAFIKPGVIHALWWFIVIAPALFWIVLLITALTLMPQLLTRGARGRIASWAYLVAGVAVGIAVVEKPLNIGNTPAAFWLGMAALVWPIWMAAIDHRVWPAPTVHHADPVRALMACIVSAVIACATYAVPAPLRLVQTVGIDLPPRMMTAAIGSSLVMDLFIFMAWFLTILTVTGISRANGVSAAAEYWLLLVPLGLCAAVVMNAIVCVSLGLFGPPSIACSVALALAVTAVWADLVRLRSQAPLPANGQSGAPAPGSIDSVALFSSPVAGARSPAAAVVVLLALPFLANAFVSLFRELDWNFLLQKLSVLTIWCFLFAAAHLALGRRGPWQVSRGWVIAVPIAALVLYRLLALIDPRVTIDRYAALDPSMRFIRDARTAQSADTAKRYAYLRSQTLVMPETVRPPEVDFVRPLGPAAGRKPHIFLVVIDSLRRDYLAPYDARATFTPQIAKLAADSFVFEHAWTRYAGTLLAVPSIWAGGLVPHVVRQPRFRDRNVLLKLLDGNDYRRLMDMDSVVETFDLRDQRLIELNPGHEIWAATDFCTTVDAFKKQLPRDRTQPIFFYSLPQNIHPTVALARKVPPGETYPSGFDARVASSLHRVDACFGAFMEFLKHERLYDDSVIIVTSDHGDLLGEEGRWGHSFWLYPDVMKVPLIVHVPAWLRAPFRTDLNLQVFTTDIAPSLYVLLGYQPQDLGPLFGQSFFTPRDGDSYRRRRQETLLASSYGAVYGVLSQNGRRLYVVDTVDATEYALVLKSGLRRLAVTPVMTAVNRRTIADQLQALATFYRYPP